MNLVRSSAVVLVAGALAASGACSRGAPSGTGVDTAPTPAPAPDPSGMTLSSPDFAEGQPIPRAHAYTGEGDNVPPRLTWSNLPAGTVELALIVDDPDAPRPEPWVHDVLYKIPVDATPDEMVLRGAAVDSAARFVSGTNSWDQPGWGGPMPPPGDPHRYFFRLYALDTELDLPPGLAKEQLLERIEGHVLGTAVLMGTYQR